MALLMRAVAAARKNFIRWISYTDEERAAAARTGAGPYVIAKYGAPWEPTDVDDLRWVPRPGMNSGDYRQAEMQNLVSRHCEAGNRSALVMLGAIEAGAGSYREFRRDKLPMQTDGNINWDALPDPEGLDGDQRVREVALGLFGTADEAVLCNTTGYRAFLEKAARAQRRNEEQRQARLRNARQPNSSAVEGIWREPSAAQPTVAATSLRGPSVAQPAAAEPASAAERRGGKAVPTASTPADPRPPLRRARAQRATSSYGGPAGKRRAKSSITPPPIVSNAAAAGREGARQWRHQSSTDGSYADDRDLRYRQDERGPAPSQAPRTPRAGGVERTAARPPQPAPIGQRQRPRVATGEQRAAWSSRAEPSRRGDRYHEVPARSHGRDRWGDGRWESYDGRWQSYGGRGDWTQRGQRVEEDDGYDYDDRRDRSRRRDQESRADYYRY